MRRNEKTAVPRAYIFRREAGLETILAKLKIHGIACEELTAAAKLEVETFVIDKVTRATREFQGHRAINIKGHAQTETVEFPAGSIIVRTGQPLANLAFYLLEAESDDGFVAWNFLDNYLEANKTYPLYKLMKQPKISIRVSP